MKKTVFIALALIPLIPKAESQEKVIPSQHEMHTYLSLINQSSKFSNWNINENNEKTIKAISTNCLTISNHKKTPASTFVIYKQQNQKGETEVYTSIWNTSLTSDKNKNTIEHKYTVNTLTKRSSLAFKVKDIELKDDNLSTWKFEILNRKIGKSYSTNKLIKTLNKYSEKEAIFNFSRMNENGSYEFITSCSLKGFKEAAIALQKP